MSFRTSAVLAAALLVLSCGSSGYPDADTYRDPAAVEARLRTTMMDLAAMGEKQPNTPGGQQAAAYVTERFEAAGLVDVGVETFAFPAWQLQESTLSLSVDGTPLEIDHAVLAYSPSAELAGLDVVDGGRGREADFEGVDVSGKAVLIERDSLFHRSSQYQVVQAHGAAAMLYISASPDNHVQVGSVGYFYTDEPTIPAFSIGADDGARLSEALQASETVSFDASVVASVAQTEGRNIAGWAPGSDPAEPYLLVGGHYDTWMTGAVDNSTAIAAMLEMAEAIAQRRPGALGLRFVALDAEEPGIFGAYAFLREHTVVRGERVLAYINLEQPASDGRGLCALLHSRGSPIEPVLMEARTRALYPVFAGLEAGPPLSGGPISTDLQGFYRTGVPTFSTVCQTALYHTVADVPDIVAWGDLAAASMHFQEVIELLDEVPAEDFDVRDPNLWEARVSTTGDAELVVDVAVRDETGAPAVSPWVEVIVMVDDFDRTFREKVTGGVDGRARVTVPAAAARAGSGRRWLQVNAGESFPLVEVMQRIEP
jgi:hypothetical protein